MRISSSITLIVLGLLVGCAGPHNPFGRLAGWGLGVEESKSTYMASFHDTSNSNSKIKTLVLPSAKIVFSPDAQVWHKPADLIVTIYDHQGVLPDYKVTFIYNGENITDQINALYPGKIGDYQIDYDLSSLRLLPTEDHQFQVSYQRSSFHAPIIANYLKPTCHFEGAWAMGDRSPASSFSDPDVVDVARAVNRVAQGEGINPYFMLGLVAQESSFNPKAVSDAKAIGLTQITSIAEKEILESVASWPRYEGISDFTVPNLRFYIMSGYINPQNEWRLDSEKNIIGGIQYLKYLDRYWAGRDQRFILNSLPYYDREALLLASYNSGANRVRRALVKHAEDWIKAREFRGVRHYVGRVKSFCYHYSKGHL